jgi:hypothetical protein
MPILTITQPNPVDMRLFGQGRSSWLASGNWPRRLIVVQIGCQLALLSSAIGAARPIVRVLAFGIGLVLLFLLIFLPPQTKPHPAAKIGWIIMAIMVLSVFNPLTNLQAGVAQVGLYLAILSPLFWVSRLDFPPAYLRKLFVTIWIFYTLSSIVGVLQVVFPGHLQPPLSSVIAAKDLGYIDSLLIETATGEWTFRPMGLTDSPGGAALAGFYAVLIGMGLFLTTRSAAMRIGCGFSMIVGMACLYLCQVRSLLVVSILCIITFIGILIRRGQGRRLISLGFVAGIGIAGGFALAVLLGGESVISRLQTLVAGSPGEVYYQNRGKFLEYTVYDLLPRFPFGAGLGRWGMTSLYFGTGGDIMASEDVYVEIQWTGWVLDGGLPLVLAYLLALLFALRFSWKLATSNDDRFWMWGAMLVAYDVAAIALTFNAQYFISQGGMEFWLVNAALFAAVQSSRQKVVRTSPDLQFRSGLEVTRGLSLTSLN